ncbi:replication factor A [Halorubrum sp. ASP1]|uniref:replication factor A n=1 Tax=Halorubrum sp. ASP1 TaxID=2518114 RepID=UPI0010F7B45B|nr:replication factor A [Halorubrum sp. ASP1]TKX60710.1 replication factor A [Halorubrum sp. ASP1]
MSDIQSEAVTIAEDTDEYSVEEIAGKLAEMHEEYRVPLEEAVTSVRDDLGVWGNDEVTDLENVEGDENWYNLEVKVVDLWEPRSDAMAQVGLIGDETDTRKFVWFDGTDGIPTLEEGECYSLDTVVSDEYEDSTSVKLTTPTEVEHHPDMEIEVPESGTTHTGTVVNIESGSGLIKRCPEEDCTRVLNNGRCSEHGEVDGEFDMRIKATVDDGLDTPTVVFDKEATEELTGISLSDAEEMAKDALDTSVVAQEMEDELLAEQVTVTGPEYENGGSSTISADSFDISSGISADDIDAALVKARSNA